ncbi:hypothetical protein NRK68_34660 (plasmid) [Streptomyces yangpuensis]|uniref:Uncharacterized protein n=1 Tax=Streptomyces yangpuensis TaxID=1648182 RepID=A0ABY5Q853_9ACTN|nr:hypothetical protein [Streptomyces yangpuensis]UUY52410.1 hypothetical protein NRK68_34660 [Streptomyces yangpuensis]
MTLLKNQQLDASELEPLAAPSEGAWKVLRPLCELTRSALASLPGVPEEESIAGILQSTDGKKVRFTESGLAGLDHELPYAMMEAAGLSIGDPALLLSEFTGATIITRLQPGLLFENCGGDPAPAVTDPQAEDARVQRPLDDAFRSALFARLHSE